MDVSKMVNKVMEHSYFLTKNGKNEAESSSYYGPRAHIVC